MADVPIPSGVEGVAPLPTRRDNVKFTTLVIGGMAGLVAIACLSVALLVASWTGKSQQDQLARNNIATLCRSQKAIDESGALDNATIALLDSIVHLGNQQSLDYTQIAAASAALKAAQEARADSVEVCK